MMLSDVFIGKKVVQQIFLNNMVIYQAKGWQTLPVDCKELWTKDYSPCLTENVTCATFDHCENIIFKNNSGTLFKIDKEGHMLWSYRVFSNNGRDDNIFCDQQNNIYVPRSVPSSSSSNTTYEIAVLNENGELIREIDLSAFSEIAGLPVRTIIGNGEYIYFLMQNYVLIITQKGDYIDLYKNTALSIPTAAIIDKSNQILYIGTDQGNILKFNLKSNGALSSPECVLKNNNNNSLSINQIKIDSVGNFYILSKTGSQFQIRKYQNISDNCIFEINLRNNNNLLAPYFSLGPNGGIYVCYVSSRENKTNISKYSVDGSLIYTNFELPGAGFSYGAVLVDEHNNIYCIFGGTRLSLRLTKFIEIVKEESGNHNDSANI